MAHSQEPESDPNGRRHRPWRWMGLAVGSVLVVGSIGAAWRGWTIAQNNLPQWLSATLSEALQRPVAIGDLEALGPGGIRFGASAIPPTATDPDTVTLDAIDIRFNLLDLLGRQLPLTIDLESVEGRLEQAADGEWIALDIQPPEEEDRPQERLIGVRVAGITIKPQTLRLTDSTLTAVPYPVPGRAPVTVSYADVQSRVDFSDITVDDPAGPALVLKTQQIDFSLSGASVQGGEFDVQGAVLLPPLAPSGSPQATPASPMAWLPGVLDRRWGGARALAARSPQVSGGPRVKLNFRAQETRVTDVMPLVDSFLKNPLPVQFPSGVVSGATEFERNGEDPWSLNGMARVRDGTVVTRGMPDPVQDLEGDVRFQGQTFEFEGVTARMGELTAAAGGSLNLQTGYDLAGQFDPFTLAQVSDLFEVAVPVAVEGTFMADVTMTGPLNKPILAADLAAQSPVTIDQVLFSAITATAVLQAPELQLESLQALPQAGGSLTGSGRYTFGQPGNLALNLSGDSLPADALGRPYGLSEAVTLGPVFVEANLNGPVDQLTATANWRAPAGDYPARGDLRYANNTLQVTDTFVQVAGGTVSGDGTLANRQWSADLQARGVQLNPFAPGVQGNLTADARLSGSLDNTSLDGIQGQGTATAALVGGNVTAQGRLDQGRWSADVQGNDLRLAAFSPALQGSGSGNFNLSGTTADLTLAGSQGQGQVVLSDGLATAAPSAPQLAAVREPLVADLGWNGQVIQVQQASTAGIRVEGTVTPQLQGPTAPAIANLDLNLTVDDYNLAALPLPDLVPVGGAASFAGRLTGRPDTLSLVGNASLTGLTVSQLAFASPLTGPVVYSRPGELTVDLRGGRDRIQVASQQGENDLDFLVTSGDAYVQGYRRADNLYAQIQNLPLDGLKLPPGGIDGIGTVSGTIASATVEANLRQPRVRTSFDILDPGLGYISLQTVDVNPATAAGAMDSNGPVPAPDVPAPPGAPPVPVMETRYGRLRGTVTYANDVLTLVGVNIESASGVSRYMASGTVTLGDSPLVNATLEVDNGEIQDILLSLKIFELADFRLNLLQPPAWYRPITAADLADLETTPVGDPNASLLEQIRRLAEIQELQTILNAQADAAPFPPLDQLKGRFSGRVTAQGAVPETVLVNVDLAGENWVWGTANHNGPPYQIDQLTVQGRYQDQVITLNPVLLRSAPEGVDPEANGVARARLNGEFSLDREDPITRTLELDVANVSLDTLRRPLRLPPNLDGKLNIGATLTGSLDNPQVRGRLQVDEAMINREEITQAAANFLYKDARLNLIGNLAVEDNQETPLNLTASIPYQLPIATRPPDTNDLLVNLTVQDEGFALVNLLTQTVAWESGEASLNLDLRGTLPRGDDFQTALTSLSVGGTASLRGVTLSSTLLPEPLTNIQGDIQVVNDSGTGLTSSVYRTGLVLAFDDVRGDFSQGEIVAQGNLKVLPSINDLFPGVIDEDAPVSSPPQTDVVPDNPEPVVAPGEEGAIATDTSPPASFDGITASGSAVTPGAGSTPLRVMLNNIDLALKGLYNGEVDGEIIVDGAIFLLEPLISGGVRLSNGIISLPETGDGQVAMSAAGAGGTNGSLFKPLSPTFTDFDLTLAENVRIAIAGLVDVTAAGRLDLVGTLPDVKPEGRINLPSGRINLLTTAFRLTGNDNYAEFRPGDEKIDPYLVANLSTAVSDSAGAGSTLSIASPFPRNEISDAELNQLGLTQGGVETIRIRAQVDGRASRVTQLQGVELSSTPPRSNSEIVALISGGVLTALESTIGSVSGGGDSFQGLIALAGSAVLNNIQEILGDSLNLSELRLFSATPQSAQNTGELDIGGEVGVNLSPNISVSVQKVFTNLTPAVFNVRYRINDNLTLRGVTSYEQFTDNTGAILEVQF
jgi:translocation and assembly module TamB